MLTPVDFGVMICFLALNVVTGWWSRSLVKDSGDFFRAGGRMSWWMVGISTFMASFSSWTFTGAAGIAYEHGIVVLGIYFANVLGFLLNAACFAPWFRQLRVVTAMQAVRARFGAGSELFYTWLQLPLQLIGAGIPLLGLAVFVSPVFGLGVQTTVLAVGVVVVILAVMGGAWAVSMSDFVQFLVLLPITILVACLTLGRFEGLEAFIAALPQENLRISAGAASTFGWLWLFANLLRQLIVHNNLHAAARYLCVKDGRGARKAALLSAGLFAIGPLLWIIPPLAARALEFDLALRFPGLSHPQEGAYMAIALDVLPTGLIGVLMVAMFAATMSSLDTALSRNVGLLVKNFYEPVLRPHASERERLIVAKVATGCFGGVVIGLALIYSSWEQIGLFELMLNFSGLIGLPVGVSLFWALLLRRAPAWAGWSTALVGFSVSFTVSVAWQWEGVQGVIAGLMGPEAVAWVADHAFIAGVFSILLIGSGWFWATALFWPSRDAAYQAKTAAFFAQMHRPIDFSAEVGAANDQQQAKMLARLTFGYAGLLSLLLLVPNPLSARLGILFCVGFVGLCGGLLWWVSRREKPTA